MVRWRRFFQECFAHGRNRHSAQASCPRSGWTASAWQSGGSDPRGREQGQSASNPVGVRGTNPPSPRRRARCHAVCRSQISRAQTEGCPRRSVRCGPASAGATSCQAHVPGSHATQLGSAVPVEAGAATRRAAGLRYFGPPPVGFGTPGAEKRHALGLEASQPELEHTPRRAVEPLQVVHRDQQRRVSCQPSQDGEESRRNRPLGGRCARACRSARRSATSSAWRCGVGSSSTTAPLTPNIRSANPAKVRALSSGRVDWPGYRHTALLGLSHCRLPQRRLTDPDVTVQYQPSRPQSASLEKLRGGAQLVLPPDDAGRQHRRPLAFVPGEV